MRRVGRDLLVKVNSWAESVHGESEVFVEFNHVFEIAMRTVFCEMMAQSSAVRSLLSQQEREVHTHQNTAGTWHTSHTSHTHPRVQWYHHQHIDKLS